MHKFFAEWYRIAGIEPKGDDLPKRWAGVESLISEIDVSRSLDVARLYLDARLKSEIKDQFAAIFQKSDPAFPMRNNGLELRVLAGATVAEYVEKHSDEASDSIALAVSAGTYLREPLLIPEIPQIAQNYLFLEGQRIRTRAEHEIKAFSLKSDQLLAEAKNTAPQNNVGVMLNAMDAPLQKLYTQIGSTTEATIKAVDKIEIALASLREQTNILWWVFAGFSQDFRQAYSELPWPAACLIAGKELADLTELLPGPVSVPAVLDKMLSSMGKNRETFSFVDAISGLSRKCRESYLKEAEVHLEDLNPLHLSMRKSLEGDNWAPSFEDASGLKVKDRITDVGLAIQMYNERLLQRAARK
jgi:hypothetical protein